MQQGMVEEIKGLRTGNGKQVFRWGGDYTSVKDAMHFEIVVSPADLATGVVQPGGASNQRGQLIPSVCELVVECFVCLLRVHVCFHRQVTRVPVTQRQTLPV
jgi:hypothetical protein